MQNLIIVLEYYDSCVKCCSQALAVLETTLKHSRDQLKKEEVNRKSLVKACDEVRKSWPCTYVHSTLHALMDVLQVAQQVCILRTCICTVNVMKGLEAMEKCT